jgi:hypothetical protein
VRGFTLVEQILIYSLGTGVVLAGICAIGMRMSARTSRMRLTEEGEQSDALISAASETLPSGKTIGRTGWFLPAPGADTAQQQHIYE